MLASHLTSGSTDVLVMLMSNPPLASGSFYHIYNRGVEKRDIFLGRRDLSRFLAAIDFYRKSPQPTKFSDFKRGFSPLKKITEQKETIRIYCYALVPNHFHLLVQQLEENGITEFMRKLLDSYTKYFNIKYERVGPLFQGSFKAKLIESEAYILYLTKYMHKNVLPHSKWEHELNICSSYPYYLSGTEHSFCNTKFILDYFSKTNPNLSYQNFMEEEDLDDPMLYGLYIDPEE